MSALIDAKFAAAREFDPRDLIAIRRAAQAERAEAIAELIVKVVRAVIAAPAKLKSVLARKAAYDQLMSLDDRLLKDIGLCRGEIELAIEGQLPFGRVVAANENVGRPANDTRPSRAA